MDGLGNSCITALFPFFVRYIVKPEGFRAQQHGTSMSSTTCMGMGMVAMLLFAIGALPIWLLLAKKLGKFYTWILFNICNVCTNLLLLIPQEGGCGVRSLL